jgi:flavin-dependent dehydrogenase
MSIEKVLVVGGGLAGMTLATALARKGVRAGIVEISQQWFALGVGISVQGPTLRALKTVGALDACVERGFGYSSVITCDTAGNVTARVELPKLNGPDYPATLGIMRPILNDILIEGVEAAGVPVGFGVTVQSIEQEADQVAVKLTRRFARTLRPHRRSGWRQLEDARAVVRSRGGARADRAGRVAGHRAATARSPGTVFVLRPAQQVRLQPGFAGRDVRLSRGEHGPRAAPHSAHPG